MTITTKWILPVAAVTAVALSSFSINAAESSVEGAPTRSVKVWDLDLSDSQDVQTLYQRVQIAATDVCRSAARRHWKETRTAAPMGWTDACVADAVDAAVRDVGNPLLAALHIRTGVARND
jgi:UrcA family protein